MLFASDSLHARQLKQVDRAAASPGRGGCVRYFVNDVEVRAQFDTMSPALF